MLQLHKCFICILAWSGKTPLISKYLFREAFKNTQIWPHPWKFLVENVIPTPWEQAATIKTLPLSLLHKIITPHTCKIQFMPVLDLFCDIFSKFLHDNLSINCRSIGVWGWEKCGVVWPSKLPVNILLVWAWPSSVPACYIHFQTNWCALVST